MVKLYSSGCTRCNMIENILRAKNIEYEVTHDETHYLNIANDNNITVMPFAEIDGKIYNSMELQRWINER